MTVNSQQSTVNRGLRAALLALCALIGVAGRTAAQDTVQIIRPEARAPDTTAGAQLSAEVLAELLAAWNDSLTTRITGNFLLPPGARLAGPVAVFRGNLRIAGELTGRVTVINGDLVVDPGGSVSGTVLVVGGRIEVRPGGSLAGRRRAFPQGALLYRTSAGLLAIREPARSLGDIASARARLTSGRFRTTLSIETGRTYNRVEGLPIVFGPTIVREGLPNVEGRLDLRGIGWTAADRTDRRASFGYSGRLEFRFCGRCGDRTCLLRARDRHRWLRTHSRRLQRRHRHQADGRAYLDPWARAELSDSRLRFRLRALD